MAVIYFTLDLVLCLHNRKVIQFKENGFETFVYDIMIAMASCMVFVSGVMLLRTIKSFIKNLCLFIRQKKVVKEKITPKKKFDVSKAESILVPVI